MQLIRFDKEAIDVYGMIKLGFTYRAWQEMIDLKADPQETVHRLSALPRLILVPKKDKNSFFLHTTFGNFQCGINEKDGNGFTVVSYQENDLHSQNRALKFGVVFHAIGGMDVEVLLPDFDCCYKYISGKQYDYNAVECGDTKPSMEQICGELWKQKNRSLFVENGEKAASEEEAAPEKTVEELYAEQYLEEMLRTSEQYSVLASEVERQMQQEKGQLSYREFYPASYDRIDRVAYTFVVDALDRNVFGEGVRVELDGNGGERLGGEIVLADDSDESHIEVTILFNNQLDFSAVPGFGWISLSVSTVNRDVQLEANEKIKNGTAKAKYFPAVLGANQPAGFENKDLAKVREALAREQYPPNASQVSAIEKGINTKDVFLVMGPPGTGKTTVILQWVKYFVTVEHKRVLVSSQNNKAVDNVLARLAEERDIDTIRIGSEAKLQAEIVPYLFENKLKRLNQSIDRSTTDAAERLSKAIREWETYKKTFFCFDRQLVRIDRLCKELREDITTQALPYAEKKREIYLEYREALYHKKKIQEKLDECNKSLAEYQAKNFIMRKLSEKQNEERLTEKEQLEQALAVSAEAVQKAKLSFERRQKAYGMQIEGIKNNFLREMSAAKQKNMQDIENFEDKRPANPGVAHCFEKIRLTLADLTSAVKLRLYLNRIDQELMRARRLLNMEGEWREKVVGKQHYALNEVVLETVDLVGATCIGINSQKRFSSLHFDITIIDEAGQIQIHNALVPMSVSNKLIMLGDYQQIPPSADQELVRACEQNGVNTELLYKSLFEKMYRELPEENKMMLDTQYRMPGEIADVISDWFYDGGYLSYYEKRNMRGLLPELSAKPFLVIDTSRADKKGESKTAANGTYNTLEASICGQIVEYAAGRGQGLKLSEIGVISAYKEQVKKIVQELSKTVGKEQAHEMAATLDSFQGQERDLILYSFTKSSGISPDRPRIGFLNELRRLNVAMSRCKKTLILIGDMEFLSNCRNKRSGEDGRPVYEQSEAQFSEFIRLLLSAAANGNGEILSYEEFTERMGQ